MVQIRVADEFLPLDRVLPADAVGNKAHNLSVLFAAGVRVPPGFVVGFDANIDASALTAAATGLAQTLVVRSSASAEDGDGHTAPGLFDSVRDVAANDVASAVRTVRASAAPDRVAGYPFAASVRMAVIVQQQIAGTRGTMYTRTAAGPMVIEARGDHGVRFVASVDHDTGHVEHDPGFPLAVSELSTAATACERALARDGLDIEWVHDGDALWIVQARPLARGVVQPLVLMRHFAFSSGDDRVWRWDAEHNPRPLSPAQAGLVERVDEAGVAGYDMRVVQGYLYYAGGGHDATGFDTTAEVEACFGQLANAVPAPAALEQTVADYVAFYRMYARCSARLAATDHDLVATAAGDIDDLIADAAPEWDVACAPYGAAAANDAVVARYLSRPGERNDLYFGRAQRRVRDCLLQVGHALGLSEVDDVFWLPLSDVCAWSAGADAPSAAALAQLAAANRARARVQAQWRMPLAVCDGEAIDANDAQRGIWHGHGSGARVTAIVAASAAQLGAGEALVAAAITPQMVVQARRAACLVSDHGGPLSHAVAMARELGIPCVVGCRGASAQLSAGDHIMVDGSTGVVVRLPRD